MTAWNSFCNVELTVMKEVGALALLELVCSLILGAWGQGSPGFLALSSGGELCHAELVAGGRGEHVVALTAVAEI